MITLKNKKILILGVSQKTVASLNLLKNAGATLIVYEGKDRFDDAVLKGIASLTSNRIVGDFPFLLPPEIDIVLLLGAKANYQELLSFFEERKIPIFGAIDLALQNSKVPYVGITGTNGKSTTAKMLELMLQSAQKPVFLGGGPFEPFLNLLDPQKKYAIAVFEMSSSKLELCKNFHPKVAVIPSLVPAHFERHETLSHYFDAKAKVLLEQNTSDFLIYPGENPYCEKLAQKAKSQLLPVYFKKPVAPIPSRHFAFYENGYLTVQIDGSQVGYYQIEGAKLQGQHQILNALCAASAAQILHGNSGQIQSVIKTFEGLPHRMQKVLEKNGLIFYDDSRSYNPAATAWGLTAFRKPVILIFGGLDFGADYKTLYRSLKSKVRILIVFGFARRKIFSQVEGATQTYLVETLEEAVELAFSKAQKGEAIVFSPGSPPETFRDSGYLSRAEHFLRAVKNQTGVETDKKRRQDALSPFNFKI